MNGVIYCRVSSKEQVEGTSLDTQEAACREYARLHQIDVARVFREEGESAKVAERTQLLALLGYCQKKAHAINVLIVWKVDRFARNVEDHYHVKATLRGCGVAIASATEPIQQDANGKLLETILAGFAQFDNEIRTARTIEGMRQRLREGIHPWKPPIGYTPVPKGDVKKTEPDRPTPKIFPLLKEVWHRFASGTDTQADLTRFLNREGLRTTRGHKIRQQFVDRLLTSPFYAGILTDPWTGEQFPGRHLAMVTPETFARVQATLKKRRPGREPFATAVFGIRGLVRCQACQHYLTASMSRGQTKRYPYYRCNNAKCERRNKSIAAVLITNEFNAFLGRSSLRRHVLPNIVAMVAQLLQERSASRTQRLDRVRTDIRDAERQLQSLVRLLARELIEESEFVEQRKYLRARKAELEGELEELSSRVPSLAAIEQVITTITALDDLYCAIAPCDRRQFQRLLLPDGYVFGSIGTATKSLLCSLDEQFEPGDSQLGDFIAANWNGIVEELQVFSALLERTKPGQETEAA